MDLTVELDALIGNVMGEVLQREPLGPDDDFFDNGGDSLRAIDVLQRLRTADGVGTSLDDVDMRAILLEAIFESPTPAGLAGVVRQRG